MRHTPSYLLTDPDEVRRLIRGNPWATIVSPASGLVASHYPFLLEEPAEGEDPGDGISLVSHVGRPDEEAHELGRHEVLLIIQGPHGYVSPGWYPPDQFIPTWNHVTAHLWGTPEILSDEENFAVLSRLVDHFEQRMPHPVSLQIDEERARGIARGTVGIRVRVRRIDARAKLSQDKDPAVIESVISALRAPGPYENPALAAEMVREHGEPNPQRSAPQDPSSDRGDD